LSAGGRPVVFTGRDEDAGGNVAAACPSSLYVAGDVALAEDCRRVVERALAESGGVLAGLVNNAGIGRRVPFATAEIADWDQVMAINARSAFLFTRYAFDGLVRGRGAVVNVASVAGFVGAEGLAIYTASKAAMIGMTQSLALE